jgi:zinc transport system substrate-binding protein
MRQLLAAALAAAFVTTPALADPPPKVVATIKPIHSLVAAVMGDVGAPDLLVKGAASPHTYSLRPSDAAALEGADLIFRVGLGFEVFLDDALDSLAGDAEVVGLVANPGIRLLPLREGGAFEAHAHEGDEHGHDEGEEEDHDEGEEGHDEGEEGHDEGLERDLAHGGMDLHVWLDPVYATFMLSHIADSLSAADPEHMDTYFANATAEIDRIKATMAEIDGMLAPVRDKPFIVFHDATHYFEERFGLVAAGSITVSPDVLPGAQRIAELRRTVTETGAACAFAEPNFEPGLIKTIIDGTPANSGTLDPEGALLAEGPELYRALLIALATSFATCLGQ